MRRSSSTSHIPVVRTNENKGRSKSITRSSVKDSNIKKSNTGATPRTGLKRSTSSTGLKKTIAATPLSKVRLFVGKKSSITPTSAGLKRSNSNLTPASSQRSHSKSPYRITADWAVHDRAWVAQQTAKVVYYLQEHNENIANILKPPITINTFVYVMNVLLKEIDPRFEINTVNYKDMVLNLLKTLHYPGSISNSLLKTVNTKHAWPQVVCIFMWLVNLNSVLKRVDMPVNPTLAENIQFKKVQAIKDYLFERYLLYNAGKSVEEADEKFVKNFGKILNVDEFEIKKLEEEITSLSKLKDEETQKLTQQNTKNNELNNEIAELQSEIDTFYLKREERLEDVDCAIALLKTRREKISDAIKIKMKNIATLTETIKKQPCTIEEKKRMLKHIDEMKHTISLKKQKIKNQKAITDDCDSKLTEAKKKVQTQLYAFNSRVMKRAVLEPELKILYLQETDFLSQQFKTDVEAVEKNIKLFETKFTKEMEDINVSISKIKGEIAALEKQCQDSRQTIKSLKDNQTNLEKKIEICNEDMEAAVANQERDKKLVIQKMKEAEESRRNLQELNDKLKQIKELEYKKERDFETYKEQSLKFFNSLREIGLGNLSKMNDIRTEMFDFLKESMEKVNEAQNEIVEDLNHLL